MAQLTEFGKSVKKKLIDVGQPQKWLIGEVADKTGLYFDDSYLYKVLTGQLSTPKIVEAIKQVLNIQD